MSEQRDNEKAGETVKSRWIRKSFELQMSLIHGVVPTMEELAEVQRLLAPCQLEDVSYERAATGICGHIGCGRAAQPLEGKKYLVDRKNEKVWDQTELNRFCSKACFSSYSKLKFTLQDEPAWADATRPHGPRDHTNALSPPSPSSPSVPSTAPAHSTCTTATSASKSVTPARPSTPVTSAMPFTPARPSTPVTSSIPVISVTPPAPAPPAPATCLPPPRQAATVKVRFAQEGSSVPEEAPRPDARDFSALFPGFRAVVSDPRLRERTDRISEQTQKQDRESDSDLDYSDVADYYSDLDVDDGWNNGPLHDVFLAWDGVKPVNP